MLRVRLTSDCGMILRRPLLPALPLRRLLLQFALARRLQLRLWRAAKASSSVSEQLAQPRRSPMEFAQRVREPPECLPRPPSPHAHAHLHAPRFLLLRRALTLVSLNRLVAQLRRVLTPRQHAAHARCATVGRRLRRAAEPERQHGACVRAAIPRAERRGHRLHRAVFERAAPRHRRSKLRRLKVFEAA
eukprot:4548202-Prymnesium_polylepis.1